MAEKQPTDAAGDVNNAVPRARTADSEGAPDQPRPARKRAAKAASPAEPVKTPTQAKASGPAKSTERAKTAKAVKAAKATKPAETAKATKTAKTAKATKTTKTTKATKATVTGATIAPKPATPAAPSEWAAAAWEAVSQSEPHRLAELAVAELGPRAAAWAGWLRETYPDPPAHGIARLAAHRATRLSRAVAVVGAGRPVMAAVSVPAIAWVRASVVLRIAAAYGHDPTDPRRAGELITLLELRPDQRRLGEAAPGWLSELASHSRWLVGVGVTRLVLRGRRTGIPLRALAAAADHAEQIERLAHRAATFYRAA